MQIEKNFTGIHVAMPEEKVNVLLYNACLSVFENMDGGMYGKTITHETFLKLKHALREANRSIIEQSGGKYGRHNVNSSPGRTYRGRR